jgi:hypothetical protein
MDCNPEGFQAFIDASKRASKKGDLKQAERLLKTGLNSAEQQLYLVEQALNEIVENLIELYTAQSRIEEAELMQQRLLKIDREMKQSYQSFIRKH